MIKVDGTFDIETYSWTNFMCGSLYDGNNVRSTRSEKEFFDWIYNFNGTIYAHNGGYFDTLWFLSHLDKLDITYKIIMQGSRVLSVKVNNVTIYDSLALLPMSLAKAGTIISDKKDELPFDVANMHPTNFNKSDWKILIEYCEKDCILLFDILKFVMKYAKENGLKLTNTVGSSAWKSASSLYKLPTIDWDFGQWIYARKGYYGGRVEVYKSVSEQGSRYDRNSSYPAALVETALPLGKYVFVNGGDAKKAFDRGIEGIYSAEVYVPKCYFPVLPFRTKERLIFPTGQFEGTWTRIELLYALNQGLCRINKFKHALIWDSRDNILKPFCKKIWDLRKNADTFGLNLWLKYIANSLTGKFGERAERSTLYRGEPVVCNGGTCDGNHPKNKCCEHRCIGRCSKSVAIDADGKYWTKKYNFIPHHAHPEWSAYLTASARISLHERLLEADTNAVYCDTDSVITETELTGNIGDELGQWKLEGLYKNWRAIAPKLYCYKDIFHDVEDDSEHFEYIIKGKGFPGLDKDGFDRLNVGESIRTSQRPITFNRGIKKGSVWQTIDFTKKVNRYFGWIGGRRVLKEHDVVSAPPYLPYDMEGNKLKKFKRFDLD